MIPFNGDLGTLERWECLKNAPPLFSTMAISGREVCAERIGEAEARLAGAS
jgi:hypothetical protein